MKYVFAVAAACGAALVLSGCRIESGPTIPESFNPINQLYGSVHLIGENGVPLTDRSGVTVGLEGTELSGVSDAEGRWMIAGMPAGRFTISFDKSGFARRVVRNYQISGGNQYFVGGASLVSLPGFSVEQLTARDTMDSSIGAYIALAGILSSAPHDGQSRMVRFFFGRSDRVSADPATYVATAIGWAFGSVEFSGRIYHSALAAEGIRAGDRVYIAAYGSSKSSGSYVDPATGRIVYTSVNPARSNVVFLHLQ